MDETQRPAVAVKGFRYRMGKGENGVELKKIGDMRAVVEMRVMMMEERERGGRKLAARV